MTGTAAGCVPCGAETGSDRDGQVQPDNPAQGPSSLGDLTRGRVAQARCGLPAVPLPPPRSRCHGQRPLSSQVERASLRDGPQFAHRALRESGLGGVLLAGNRLHDARWQHPVSGRRAPSDAGRVLLSEPAQPNFAISTADGGTRQYAHALVQRDEDARTSSGPLEKRLTIWRRQWIAPL